MQDVDILWRWLQAPLFTLSGTEVSVVRLAGFAAFVVIGWWISARIEQAIRRVADRHAHSRASFYAWARVTHYGIWALAILLGLDFVGLSLKSFALLGGAVGVGIGFGLQNIFSNFFSGIILLLEKTLKEGDFVDLQSGTRGLVREIGLRYTRITTNDEVDVIVPNSEFINGKVVNWTFGSDYRRLHVPFGVAYGSDKAVVKAAGLRAAAAVSATVTDARRHSDVWLKAMNDSSLDFELIVWVGPDSIKSPARVEAEYRWAIHDELVAAGLEIPFPQRDLTVRGGELRVRLAREADAPASGTDPAPTPAPVA